MEEQENLETIGIGDKEAQKLEPTKVKIVKTSIEEVGEKKSKKVQCEVKHPKAEEPIKISSAKIERKEKLAVGGLWFNQDEDGKIRKGSLLAQFLNFMEVSNVKELEGKECMTAENDSGYLVFKAY